MHTLLIINARIDRSLEAHIATGQSPRKDFLELRAALHADVIDLSALDRSRWLRAARRVLGSGIAQALLARSRSGQYDVVFADRESCGFAFALLCRFKRRRPRLVVLGHLLSTRPKQTAVRALRLAPRIDQLIVHSSLQQHIAEQQMGFDRTQVKLVPYQCDDRYWAPRDGAPARLVSSAGLEYRDYQTLIEAVRDLDLDVVIAAASQWSHHRQLTGITLPERIRTASLNYAELRDLYAESLFVVVPLVDADNQAGITTILEAMAMGKAVIVSHTRGQSDVVRDRRRQSRSDPERITQPDWGFALGATKEVSGGHTGIYVMPGDVAEMRRAIEYLLEHPEEAQVMGKNGRRFVQETMGLDLFVERVASILSGSDEVSNRAISQGPHEPQHPAATGTQGQA